MTGYRRRMPMRIDQFVVRCGNQSESAYASPWNAPNDSSVASPGCFPRCDPSADTSLGTLEQFPAPPRFFVKPSPQFVSHSCKRIRSSPFSLLLWFQLRGGAGFRPPSTQFAILRGTDRARARSWAVAWAIDFGDGDKTPFVRISCPSAA